MNKGHSSGVSSTWVGHNGASSLLREGSQQGHIHCRLPHCQHIHCSPACHSLFCQLLEEDMRNLGGVGVNWTLPAVNVAEGHASRTLVQSKHKLAAGNRSVYC